MLKEIQTARLSEKRKGGHSRGGPNGCKHDKNIWTQTFFKGHWLPKVSITVKKSNCLLGGDDVSEMRSVGSDFDCDNIKRQTAGFDLQLIGTSLHAVQMIRTILSSDSLHLALDDDFCITNTSALHKQSKTTFW